MIRIDPWEVHINDPEFYDTIYTSTRGFDKVPQHVDWTNGPESGQGTAPHALHKIRRAALNPFFSKRQIVPFAYEIQDLAETLCHKISEHGSVLRLDRAFGCVAVDVYFCSRI